jgi:hypothetical protein
MHCIERSSEGSGLDLKLRACQMTAQMTVDAMHLRFENPRRSMRLSNSRRMRPPCSAQVYWFRGGAECASRYSCAGSSCGCWAVHTGTVAFAAIGHVLRYVALGLREATSSCLRYAPEAELRDGSVVGAVVLLHGTPEAAYSLNSRSPPRDILRGALQ